MSSLQFEAELRSLGYTVAYTLYDRVIFRGTKRMGSVHPGGVILHRTGRPYTYQQALDILAAQAVNE